MLYRLSYLGISVGISVDDPSIGLNSSEGTAHLLSVITVMRKLERETGLEPATPSLEGSCSSQLSYSRLSEATWLALSSSCFPPAAIDAIARSSSICAFAPVGFTWRGKDSNLRRHRRQIYSLLPLATREPLLFLLNTARFLAPRFQRASAVS